MPFTKNDPNINRNGRPQKGKAWSDIIKSVADRVDPATKKTMLELAAEALFMKALNGDTQALREIGDRIDGKASLVNEFEEKEPPQPIMGAITLNC